MSRTWQLPNPTRFGTDDFAHRFTLARLQALWPVMCYAASHGIYGFAAYRATSLGLDHQEFARWWEMYQKGGVGALIPQAVQPKWRLDLEALEKRLAIEMSEWAAAGDHAFSMAVQEALRLGSMGPLTIPAEAVRAYANWKLTDVEEAHRPRYRGTTTAQADDLVQRMGICREILLQPIVNRAYTDEAVEAYARDWGVSGSTMRRTWLDPYDPLLGAASAAPARLTTALIEWLEQFEVRVLALRVCDTRPQRHYWKALTGADAAGTRAGVASKHLSGPAAEPLIVRYTAVKIEVVKYLCLPDGRRKMSLAAIARALRVSDQTLQNWRSAWLAGESMRPKVFSAAMAEGLDNAEAVVRQLAEATQPTEATATADETSACRDGVRAAQHQLQALGPVQTADART